MKKIFSLYFILAFSGLFLSCDAQNGKEENSATISEQEAVEVYYFHLTRRCITCNAIESVTKKALTEYYGDKVQFFSYNLDKPDSKNIARKFKVSGQTLLIVGGKERINITNEGFMHARNSPDKLKEIIKSKIDPLI